MLTKEQKKKLKNILLRRQSERIRQTNDSFGQETSFVDSVGELSSYDNHPGDMGTEMYEREKDLALNEHTEKELEEINEALHAMDEGTYGICKVCSMDISYERLKANPTANTCREHADEDTFTRNRPVEEEVFSPNINPDEKTAETQNAYDAEDAWQDVSRYGTSETPSDFYEDKESYDNMYPNSDDDDGYVEDIERYSKRHK